jgi:hypothetical protein
MMNVQSAQTPLASAGAMRPVMGNPPRLGQQIPGMTGGLPSLGGLSVAQSPMAQQLQGSQPGGYTPVGQSQQPTNNPQAQQSAQQVQQYGRGQDSMLVHMTPDEVNSLRGLAQRFGGDLTQNPHTGLPEAGWLGKLLPTLLGGLGMAFGIPPVWMGALGAVGGTAITGDLKQGLMAGLGAFGGASMAGAAGLGGAAGHLGSNIGLSGSQAAVMHPVAAAGATPAVGSAAPGTLEAAFDKTISGAQKIANPGVLGGFKQAATAGLSGPIGGTLAKLAVPAAVMGATSSISNALTPTPKPGEKPVDEYGYTGPYKAHREQFTPEGAPSLAAPAPFNPMSFDSSQKQWFGPTSYTDNSGNPWIPGQKTTPVTTPTPVVKTSMVNPNRTALATPTTPTPVVKTSMVNPNRTALATPTTPAPTLTPMSDPNTLTPEQRLQQFGYASGGPVHMREGSFVMPARETAEFGKGSTHAGQRALSSLGGIPIQGAGNGVSDDIPARIGNQEARVADGEVHFPPEAVRRLGKGSHKRGTQKLYAMMKKAEQSRKTAARGGDGANLMRGLA